MVKYLRSLFAICLLTGTLSADAQCPTLSSTSLNANCASGTDGAIDLTLTGGAGPFTFAWVGTGGFTGNTEDISGLAPGTYTVVVTSPGCSDTLTDSVILPPQVNATISANGQTVFCPGDSVQLEVTATGTNIAYQWFNDNILLTATDSTIVVYQSGNYQAVVTDTGFCPGTTGTIPVLVLPTPNVNITPSGSADLCAGNTLSITAFNDILYTYQWWNDGAVMPGEDSSVLQVNTSGTYQVVISELGMCSDTSDTVNLTVHPLPVAVISVISVNGVQKVVVNTPFAGYQWYYNSQIIADSTGQFMTSLGLGSYFAVVTDDNGCQDTSNILVLGTDVGNVRSAGQVAIYPNPTTDVVHIEAKGATLIIISDMQGRTLCSYNNVSMLNISHLTAGLYLLSVRNDEGEVLKNTKLVKE